MWGLGDWTFDDLDYMHPNDFSDPQARAWAFEDQDDVDDIDDPNETVQVTLISRAVEETEEL